MSVSELVGTMLFHPITIVAVVFLALAAVGALRREAGSPVRRALLFLALGLCVLYAVFLGVAAVSFGAPPPADPTPV